MGPEADGTWQCGARGETLSVSAWDTEHVGSPGELSLRFLELSCADQIQTMRVRQRS